MERFFYNDVNIVNGVYYVPISWSGTRFKNWKKKYVKVQPLARTKWPKLKRTNWERTKTNKKILIVKEFGMKCRQWLLPLDFAEIYTKKRPLLGYAEWHFAHPDAPGIRVVCIMDGEEEYWHLHYTRMAKKAIFPQIVRSTKQAIGEEHVFDSMQSFMEMIKY